MPWVVAAHGAKPAASCGNSCFCALCLPTSLFCYWCVGSSDLKTNNSKHASQGMKTAVKSCYSFAKPNYLVPVWHQFSHSSDSNMNNTICDVFIKNYTKRSSE